MTICHVIDLSSPSGRLTPGYLSVPSPRPPRVTPRPAYSCRLIPAQARCVKWRYRGGNKLITQNTQISSMPFTCGYFSLHMLPQIA